MKFSDRLRIALGALAGRDVIKDDIDRMLTGGGVKASQIISYDKIKAPETRLEPLIRDGWRKNELIFACVSKKANTASQIKLNVVSGPDRDEVEDHPLRLLLAHPNPSMTETNFWASVIIMQDFSGSMFFEKVRSRAGRTVQLWPMRPDWVKQVLDADGMVIGYIYTPPGKSPISYPVEDVMAFRIYDPLNEYFGYPPVAVAARVGDLDNSVTDYIRMIFQKGGVPPGILTSTQPINDAIAQRLRAMYREQYGGVANWDAPMVLGYDTKYQSTGLGLQEMGMEILDARSESRICMTLKVPAVLIGTKFGLERATLDNVKTYQMNWWDNDLIPLYKSYADVIRDQLLPEFGTGIDVEWDFDDVPALQEDQVQRRTQALSALQAGAITRNQFNEMWGLPDLGPRGDVFIMSGMLVEVPMEMTLTEMQQEMDTTDAEDANTDNTDNQDNTDNADAEDMPMDEEDATDTGKAFTPPSEYKKTIVLENERMEFDGAERNRAERKLQRALESYFKGQKGRVTAAVDESYAHRKDMKKLPISSEFWDEEAKLMYRMIFPLFEKATVLSAKAAYDKLKDVATSSMSIQWGLINENAITWAEAHTRKVVREVTKTSMTGFLKEFQPWVNSGQPLDQLVDSLTKYYEPWRANMIAVTETTRAYAEANLGVWKASEIVKGFDVITAEDDVVDEICASVQSKNPHGLDSDLPPYHVNCRCAIRPVVSV